MRVGVQRAWAVDVVWRVPADAGSAAVRERIDRLAAGADRLEGIGRAAPVGTSHSSPIASRVRFPAACSRTSVAPFFPALSQDSTSLRSFVTGFCHSGVPVSGCGGARANVVSVLRQFAHRGL